MSYRENNGLTSGERDAFNEIADNFGEKTSPIELASTDRRVTELALAHLSGEVPTPDLKEEVARYYGIDPWQLDEAIGKAKERIEKGSAV